MEKAVRKRFEKLEKRFQDHKHLQGIMGAIGEPLDDKIERLEKRTKLIGNAQERALEIMAEMLSDDKGRFERAEALIKWARKLGAIPSHKHITATEVMIAEDRKRHMKAYRESLKKTCDVYAIVLYDNVRRIADKGEYFRFAKHSDCNHQFMDTDHSDNMYFSLEGAKDMIKTMKKRHGENKYTFDIVPLPNY